MNPTQKINRLLPLIEQAAEQQKKTFRDADFTIWHDRLLGALLAVFGADSPQLKRIKELTFTYRRTVRIAGADYSAADRPKREANYQRDLVIVIGLLNNYISDLRLEQEYLLEALPVPASSHQAANLSNLHPTIQRAASSLYATGHYRQALLDAYIAVDRAVQQKSQLTGSGTRLMETAFSPGNTVLKIGESTDEQQGFLSLFRGAMLAIRNPKAHSLGGTHDAQRALEWLSFASVLLRNLDEAVLIQPTATSPPQ